MAAKEIHVDDVGTRFQTTLKEWDYDTEQEVIIDVSAALSLTMRFYRADKTSFERTAVALTGGNDGVVYYDTVAGDLSVDGIWEYQVIVELITGLWHSEKKSFEVFPNLPAPTP